MDRLIHATQWAMRLHAGQIRKGPGNIPYCAHLWAVAAMVAEYGGSEDAVIAALLHDAAEDQGGLQTLEKIRQEFGDTVAGHVAALSDTMVSPKPPWRERKELYLRNLRGAPSETKLIAAADKIHNLRAILRGLDQEGEATWGHFRGGREGTAWYFRAVYDALAGDGWDHPILREFRHELSRLKNLLSGNRPE
ncbi:MAG TPA: HD domain-containing protein [Candidatus Hydrogenedentes bacterium]|nr:HD domain-containing protein [Candidatus Hydrogenedentota bacterium]HPU97573.1 HD domain-containing protein [Candidatus Hydrogenedentota bacterium]